MFVSTGAYASINFSTGCPTATLLADGKVLIAWSYGGAELYNACTGTFSLTGAPSVWPHWATLLSNGKVLFAGGNDDPGESAGAELYDPSTGLFTATGNMTTARADDPATLLPDGSNRRQQRGR